MRSDESRVSKSRASSPDGRGVTPPISEPFPINPQTSASPNAGQPLAMQKRVRQTIITQQHSVQLAFFRNAGLPAELCRLNRNNEYPIGRDIEKSANEVVSFLFGVGIGRWRPELFRRGVAARADAFSAIEGGSAPPGAFGRILVD